MTDREEVLERTLALTVSLAVEIAREGREGRRIGTLFVVGDHEAVLGSSRPLMLDPLRGHPDEKKFLGDPDMRETVKELAQLDGAFVVSEGGVAVSAARHLDASSDGLRLPLGLGGRHVAAASVSKRTSAVAVTVSQSSMVRVFRGGELAEEVTPEIWMLEYYRPRAAAGEERPAWPRLRTPPGGEGDTGPTAA